MSYADSKLDLSDVSVACLCGSNGAGKSALLDAVTWTLWENARASSDELMRLGQKEMWVDLTFSHEGRTYRARRSRQKHTGRGQKITAKSTLELQVLLTDDVVELEDPCCDVLADDEQLQELVTLGGTASLSATAVVGGSPSQAISMETPGKRKFKVTAEPSTELRWRSLTSPAIKETQKHLIDLLRMDYDTFLNSAYLKQGKADEFTTRTPQERKHVLSEILGLSYFDRLQEQCREKVREIKSRVDLLGALLSELPESERKLAETEVELSETQVQLEAARARAASLKQQLDELTSQIQSLTNLEEKSLTSEQQHQHFMEDLRNLEIHQAELQRRMEELVALIENADQIDREVEEYDLVRKKLDEQDGKSEKMREFFEQRLRFQTELATLRSRLEVELEHEKERVTKLEEQLVKIAKDVSDREKIEAHHQEYKELLAQEAELAKRQEDFSRLTQRSNDLQSEITGVKIRMEAEAAQKDALLKEHDLLLGGELLLFEQERRLEEEKSELDKLEAQFELVEQRGHTVKSEIESIDHEVEELKRRKTENQEKLDELHEHLDSSVCPLCSSPIADRAAVMQRYVRMLEDIANDVLRAESRRTQLTDELVELRKRYSTLKTSLAQRTELDRRIGQFNEKKDAISRARANRDKLADDLAMLLKRLENHDYARIERESLIAIKAEIHKLEFDPVAYSAIQSQLRMKRNVESRYHQLKRDLLEQQRLEEELPERQKQLTAINDELEGESYGVHIREKLKLLQDAVKALDYDKDAHSLLREQLNALLPAVERKRALEKAILERPQTEHALLSNKQQIAAKKSLSDELQKELAEWKEKLTHLPELKSAATALSPQADAEESERNNLATKHAVLDARRKHLVDEISAYNTQKEELTTLRAEVDDFSLLAEAFGKKGIQAAIIENAIPEIEAEANRILARLSDNKMHIGLVTQQKTKTGGITETLELLIGDEVGTRNYELYSGGEAFKVNFAVRIALSRLLARRSGAKLETLIIDEGFGSQDEVSRDRLVKSIRSVQDDFARIIIITHISEVKEMFPAQILISKRDGVSEIDLVTY